MGIADITKEAILAAVAEHDSLGADDFLKKYKFGKARSYWLVYQGHEYDSKAIVGAAHGYLPGRSALVAADFSGGLDTVAALLRARGFEVRERRNPPWSEAELILACDIVAQNRWQAVRVHDPRAIELSRLLQAARLHPIGDRGATFRNPNSVQRKTFDIATQHPEYGGKPTRGGKLDREILHAFIDQPTEMHLRAAAIRAGIESGELNELFTSVDPEEEEAAREGRVLLLLHLRRERSPKLRAMKINDVMGRRGRLDCEVCGFDFEQTYGERGEGYAEVHHVTPLHATGPIDTRLRDLAILCANCHRMIHRGPQWLSPAELRRLVQARSIDRE